MDKPPEPFEALAGLATGADITQRAALLGKALNAVPDLQKWLRRAREEAVGDMHAKGMTYADIGTALGMDRVRAYQIAKGQTTGRKPKVEKPPKPPADPDGP